LLPNSFQHLAENVKDGAGHLGPFRLTARYLARTEVHAFGFAIAASTLLSLPPLLNVMMSLCRYAFHWRAAEDAIRFGVEAYFPVDIVDILRRAQVFQPKPFEFVSMILLLFTANGIFEPLEVALNRAWGVTKDRSYVKNQLLSFGLILLCGGLALGSFLLTAMDKEWLGRLFGASQPVPNWMLLIVFKLVAIPMIMLALFLTYWLLPNCQVPLARIAPVAVVSGLTITLLQYLVVLAWPWLILKLRHDYTPFEHSASIILFSFVASMIVLAGAEWSARRPGEPQVLPVTFEIMPSHREADRIVPVPEIQGEIRD
jgi:membrane protein